MSTLSFKAFCIEYYAAHIGRPSNEVYALFEQTGLLKLLDEDYEDLHGMSMEYLMQFFDRYLGGRGMILYHGSTLEVQQPRILKSEIGRDFGFAFYTTDIQAQAERWARRRAMIESRRTKTKVQAIVSVYEWDEDAAKQLRFLQFDGASMEWLDLVVTCRSRTDYSHGYDIVEGKIANDNVGETVSYVMQGIMRKEDAIERLRFEKINNQIAFCTETALRTLHFQNSYICGSVNP